MYNSFSSALSFLTIIRVPSQGDISKSVYSFAFVGILIGAGLAGLSLLPRSISPILMLLYLTVITGFLHLDGLADTFDGLFSHRSGVEKLEIMRDSRIGAMGAAAIALVFIAKYHAFSHALPLSALVAVPAFARFSMLILMHLLPYTRPEGLAKSFVQKMHPCTLVQLVPIELLVFWTFDFISFVVINIVFIAVVLLLWLWYTKSIGGITGDMAGAACEIVETLLFLTAVAII